MVYKKLLKVKSNWNYGGMLLEFPLPFSAELYKALLAVA